MRGISQGREGAARGKTPGAVGMSSTILSLVLAFSVVASSALCQEGPVGNLCRSFGLTASGDVARIQSSYAAAVRAGVPEDEILPFMEDVLRHKLDCYQLVRVLESIGNLRADGLPYKPVMSKVREGIAKEAPPVLVLEASDAKFRSLNLSRNVLKSLGKMGYRVRDFENAVVVVCSYLEKGYTPEEMVSRIGARGVDGVDFSALSGVVEKIEKGKER